MLLLKILGALAVLLGLLCMVRLQILVTLRGRDTSVEAAAGWIRFRVYPFPKRPKKEKPEEPPPEEAEKPETGRGFRFAPTLADIQDALRTLPGPVLRSLRRIGKGIRVHPLTVEWVLGGALEPAEAAERYGYLCAALWAFMPRAEKTVRIPEPSISLDVDFDAPSDVLRGEAGISARAGTLLAALTGTAVPAALWAFRVYRRRRRTQAEPKETAAAETETDAEREDMENGQGGSAYGDRQSPQ